MPTAHIDLRRPGLGFAMIAIQYLS